MIRFCVIGLSLLGLYTPSYGSLMFSPQEVRRVLEKRAQDRPSAHEHKGDCIACNGLLFQDPQHWSIWINGQKIEASCPQCREQHIEVLAVNQHHLKIDWHHKGKHHLITLHPNETYDAILKQVLKNQ